MQALAVICKTANIIALKITNEVYKPQGESSHKINNSIFQISVLFNTEKNLFLTWGLCFGK